jgi:hypothetical protein
MDENRSDTPEQVVKFLPKELPRSHGTPAEEAGQAIIAKIRRLLTYRMKPATAPWPWRISLRCS